MSEIKWVDEVPPNVGGGRKAVYADQLPELKANPGRWALIHTYTSANTTVAKRLRNQGFNAEVRYRRVDSKCVTDVYACWPES